ncbi:hypothetical protein Q8X48_17115 [Pseudomonas sp. QLc11A]|jgi:hypothetical protein|uniref:Uncharacterized protein n=1 Tax=Pseudomonas azerbaijanorientalis TaxID=2842350 RepID=A0ABW8W5R5_9PSED
MNDLSQDERLRSIFSEIEKREFAISANTGDTVKLSDNSEYFVKRKDFEETVLGYKARVVLERK